MTSAIVHKPGVEPHLWRLVLGPVVLALALACTSFPGVQPEDEDPPQYFGGQSSGGSVVSSSSSGGTTSSGGINSLAVITGARDACAIRGTGGVACWGAFFDSRTPQPVVNVPSAIQMAPGNLHHCGLATDHTVWCAGRNMEGQLGDGTTDYRQQAVPVRDLIHVAWVSAGDSFTCAVLQDGSARCWGANDVGQLGTGNKQGQAVPTAVQNLSGATRVCGGRDHACALHSQGKVSCWGKNAWGTLGNGSTEDSVAPVDVTQLNGIVDVDCGADQTCALNADGVVWCWGSNSYGQLGQESSTLTQSLVPISVTLPHKAVGLAVGVKHVCAVLENQQLWCWGYNGQGQLGDGTTQHRATPQPVTGLVGVLQASAHLGDHTCAVTTGSRVYCWGNNWAGQVGNGNTIDQLTPVLLTLPP